MLDSRRNIALACALSMLAGYVDGIGFLHLGGLFVSFMSGNSTRLGVSLAEAQWWQAASALGLIALFVAGAAAGSLVVLGGGAERQPWLLLIETGLLAGAGLCHAYGLSTLAIAAIVLAMGLENAVFQIDGGAGLGLTCHGRAGQGRPVPRGEPHRRAALELGAEPAVVGGARCGLGGRRAWLCPDQPRRDLVRRCRGAGFGCGDAAVARLTEPAGREMDRLEHDPRDR